MIIAVKRGMRPDMTGNSHSHSHSHSLALFVRRLETLEKDEVIPDFLEKNTHTIHNDNNAPGNKKRQT
jgi:hypothetical protein